MAHIFRTTFLATWAALAALLLVGCDASINEDIRVNAGDTSIGGATINGNVIIEDAAVVEHGGIKTVNGRISVGKGARVNNCATVNGSVVIADEARTGDVKSINGDIKIARKAKIEGDIKLVNGRVSVDRGAHVDGDIGTINGHIKLTGSIVNGSLSNYNGGISVLDGTRVDGGLKIHEKKDGSRDEDPVIVVGRNAVIAGDLEFERPVRLYIHNSAQVGSITGAEAQRYSGDEPDIG